MASREGDPGGGQGGGGKKKPAKTAKPAIFAFWCHDGVPETDGRPWLKSNSASD